MLEITSKQRKALEKAAHSLDPVVIIGQNGVTEPLVKMVASCLEAHELIKVKFNEYKEDRADYARDIAERTDSTLVRVIGNIAIFFRQNDNPEKRKIKLKKA
ncbi:YhbY family RNA-binding protein [Treponema sp.]|uniref:YhbY family RNA-binding protein n=1 Tax=Treponema sp. TaxID=166 RepID=UPI003F00B5C9